MPTLSFQIDGTPLPQGSKTAIRNRLGQQVGMREAADGKRKGRRSGGLKRWRQDVARVAQIAAARERWEITTQPVSLTLRFVTKARPSSWPSWRRYPTSKPDTSKLARAVEDALEGVLYADDKQVVDLHAFKRVGPHPGVFVILEVLDERDT